LSDSTRKKPNKTAASREFNPVNLGAIPARSQCLKDLEHLGVCLGLANGQLPFAICFVFKDLQHVRLGGPACSIFLACSQRLGASSFSLKPADGTRFPARKSRDFGRFRKDIA
jgi:hypothetical protein